MSLASPLAEALRDRYIIEREIGHGGMATVYLAHDLRHDRLVALKVLLPELAQALGVERFLREIKVAARLQHPHILSVHDSGEMAGQFWFTMPYVEGESLRERLNREKQFSVEEALRIVGEAADALDCAHRHRVIHRDIKPENILLSEGHALVADFGISRALESTTAEEPLTQTGVVVGTPIYMSPEQAAGERALDGRSDIYSLGIVLYELLAGEAPYTGPSAQVITAKRFSDPVPLVRRVRPAVPEIVDQAIQRALARVPADRFSTAAEFARELRVPSGAAAIPLRTSTSPSLTSAAASHRRERVSLAVALGVGFLLGLGGLFGLLRSGSQRDAVAGGLSKRLVVLPFESTGDATEQAFAIGISEEITTRLARVPGLSLIGRSSALRYPRSSQTAPEFGRALGVDYVLDGTVRSAVRQTGQKHLRITPELIRVADGTHVWGAPYEGLTGDVFTLQADVAERVAEALRGTLESSQQRAVRAGPTENLEAFRLYTLGRAEWNRRTQQSLVQAADYFQRAIARDSTFARAWAGLADTYALYQYYGVRGLSRDSAYTRAKSAALRAIVLDSTLAEPHASLNQILRYGYWDWEGSEREVRRAIALDPNYATAHKWLAEHLMGLGRFPEAITEARTAVQLEPLAEPPQNTLAVALWYAGRTDQAIAVFRTALARDSRSPSLGVNLFTVYVTAGRTDDAVAFMAERYDTSTLRRALVKRPSDPTARAVLLAAFTAVRGRRARLDQARVHVFLGEYQEALSELEGAVAERIPALEAIRVDPVWAALRGHSRFRAIVARMGLPE